MMALRRALHFVFKVGDRTKTATFYRDVLGMKVRHCISPSSNCCEDFALIADKTVMMLQNYVFTHCTFFSIIQIYK